MMIGALLPIISITRLYYYCDAGQGITQSNSPISCAVSELWQNFGRQNTNIDNIQHSRSESHSPLSNNLSSGDNRNGNLSFLMIPVSSGDFYKIFFPSHLGAVGLYCVVDIYEH